MTSDSRNEFCWSQEQNLIRKSESDLSAVAIIPTDMESIMALHKGKHTTQLPKNPGATLGCLKQFPCFPENKT